VRVYLDSSVVLRVVFGEPGRLSTWHRIEAGVSSELVRLECLRTIDRARIRLGLGDADVARYRADVLDLIDGMTIVALDRTILERAAEPFPTTLGALDAVHLASALLARDQIAGLRMATHDLALATAATAMGFQVDGAHEQPSRLPRRPTRPGPPTS
jgi:predicted nucleic acid-binding protein